MIYLSQTLYLWWLAAFGLGVASAFFAPSGDDDNAGAWLAGGLSLFALAAMAAFAHVVSGRAGLWLDTGVLAVAAYGVGSLVGAALAAPFVTSGASAPAAKRRLQELLSTDAPACAEPIREAPAAAAGAAVETEIPQPDPAKVLGDAQDDEGCAQPMARPSDDLRLIRGVDAAISKKLHALGVWRFAEIAKWGPEQIAWAAQKLGSPASPKNWPAQARLLAAGALTDHARAVLNGEQPAPADEDALAAWLKTLLQPAAPGAGDGFYAGSRPTGFSEPPLGETDDLTRLSGVDAEIAARLNGLGVWTLRQIACWSQENARWVGAYLATPGAPEREDWIGQARALAAPARRPV
jgi:predicted flap endonuclease-1-like 5' DNA nuclease